MENLTPKQRIFCEEYVIDWNATRAAIAAGYSENSAYAIGSENLKKLELQQYIEHIQKDISKLAGISALKNIMELQKIAFNPSGREPDRMKAMEILNKMLGYDSPDKLDISTLGDKLSNTPTIVFKKIKDE